MTFLDNTKNKISNLAGKVKDIAAPNGTRRRASGAEFSGAADHHVASSRAGKDGDGAYVGRTGPDVAQDVEQSGAEARSELKRLAPQPSAHPIRAGQPVAG
jgi:hypothetical protein